MISNLFEVLCAEHSLSSAKDGVLVGVVGGVFARDLQDGGDRGAVGVNQVPDHLGDVLVDKDDVDVVALDEHLQSVLNVGN